MGAFLLGNVVKLWATSDTFEGLNMVEPTKCADSGHENLLTKCADLLSDEGHPITVMWSDKDRQGCSCIFLLNEER